MRRLRHINRPHKDYGFKKEDALIEDKLNIHTDLRDDLRRISKNKATNKQIYEVFELLDVLKAIYYKMECDSLLVKTEDYILSFKFIDDQFTMKVNLHPQCQAIPDKWGEEENKKEREKKEKPKPTGDGGEGARG